MIAAILFSIFCAVLAVVSFGLGWRRRGIQADHEAAERFERGQMCWWCSMLSNKPLPEWKERIWRAIRDGDQGAP